MADALIKPGGVVDVQAATSLIFQPKPLDGLYTCSGYLPVWPVNGTARNSIAGTFRMDPSMKVQDMADILIMIQIRIYDSRTGNPLLNDSKVSP